MFLQLAHLRISNQAHVVSTTRAQALILKILVTVLVSHGQEKRSTKGVSYSSQDDPEEGRKLVNSHRSWNHCFTVNFLISPLQPASAAFPPLISEAENQVSLFWTPKKAWPLVGFSPVRIPMLLLPLSCLASFWSILVAAIWWLALSSGFWAILFLWSYWAFVLFVCQALDHSALCCVTGKTLEWLSLPGSVEPLETSSRWCNTKILAHVAG